MTDQKKTKAELISELVELRETVAELKKSEAQLKQAEKELPESKAKYRDLLDNLSAITYIGTLDPNSTTLYISPQIENILGVSVSDFNADPDLWEKMLHPEDRERFTTEALHYHSKREPYALEYRMITKDGDEIYVYDNGWIVEDNNGKPLYRQSVISDITNRKQAEKELRESEAKYRLLFETAKDAIFISDEKGKFIDVNQAACELLGYSKEEFMKLTIRDIDPKGYERLIEALGSHVKNSMFEVSPRRKDGTVLPTEVNGTVFVSGGQTMNLVVARDISERKQAEKALRESEQKYRLLFETAKDAIFITDENGKFIDVNQAACESLGYSKEEIMELSIKGIDADPEGYEQFIKARNGHVKDSMFEVNHRRKNGTLFPAEINGTIFVSGGQTMSLAIARDMSEHKQAVEAIRESETRFRELFNNMPIGVAVFEAVDKGADFVFKDYNPAGTKMDHVKREAVIGRRITEVFPGVAEFGLLDVFRRVWKTGEQEHHPVSIYKDDKLKRWRENSVYKLPSGEIVAVYTDETERMEMEESLRESEQKYRLLFETAKDAIFITDDNGEFIDVNQAACELLGYSKEEFMELTIKDIDPEGYEQFIKVRDGHVKDAMFEVNHRRKDGTVFPVEISGAFFVSHGQRMSLAIARDISARKQAEAAVSHERDKLTAILDSMADGVYIVNQKYDIEYINPTIQKEFGPIDGRKCYEYLHNLKAVCPWCKIKDVFAGKTVRWEWYSVKSNKTYDLLDTRLTNVDGSMSKLEIFRDITERKQVEEKIKAYQEQLQSLASEISATEERQRRQFATDLHDNIGQLLAVINIKLGSVRKMVPPGEMAELLNEINRLILKAFHCTQSLTHELYPPILYKLGLEPAVEGLLENLEKEHGIAYRFETKGESKQLDNDISSLLYRAVRELLINITKYAKADEVQVSIRKQGEQIKISVEDNGVGFDTSQVKPTSKQAKGFGLFSIRERLSYQGGKLDIESVIGRGTRVTITAPLTMTI